MLVLCCVAFIRPWCGLLRSWPPATARACKCASQGRLVGFANVGQTLRPAPSTSARGPRPPSYHADGSSGSNKGPSNPEYLEEVQARLDTFLLQNPGVKARRGARRAAYGQRLEASTPTSRRRARWCRCPAWPRPAAWPRRKCATWCSST
ncbi:MAG: potassium-transporting ATPase subunit C [Hymenobacter sp.]